MADAKAGRAWAGIFDELSDDAWELIAAGHIEPEDLLVLRCAARGLSRIVSLPEIWLTFISSLQARFPSLQLWPERAEHESHLQWFFRCRCACEWEEHRAEAYLAGVYPHLRQYGRVHIEGGVAMFEPEVALLQRLRGGVRGMTDRTLTVMRGLCAGL